MKSIIQQSNGCFFCGSTGLLEEHHIFFGNPGRKISEKNGFKVRLCPYCHRIDGVSPHKNRNNDLIALLKRKFANRIEIVRGGSVVVESVSMSER